MIWVKQKVREHARVTVAGPCLERGARALRPVQVHDGLVALVDANRSGDARGIKRGVPL